MKNAIPKLVAKAKAAYFFYTIGVWRETKDTLYVRIVKTLNLSVRSFLDRDLQMKSAALTYSSVLALVPALALLLAIARGFGFQDIISGALYSYFPAQHKALETGMGFVDSYLKEANNGIFVGIGIIVLLWTLVSLLSTVEETFNNIWDIKKDRTIYQKVTDYIAICLLVPILMVCSSGVSIFMSTIVQNNVRLAFLTPFVNVALEAAPLVLAWLAFSLSYFLIPNTKVQIKYAAIAGAVCAIAFQIIQLLFVNGQIYVSKYNAIYGSFAFLPLLLIWMQLSWLVLLFGCVLTYSLQNIFAFNFLGDVHTISQDYRRKISLVVAAVIFQRFHQGLTPPTRNDISTLYDIPIRLVGSIIFALHDAKLINNVMIKDDIIGYAPAIEASSLTAGALLRRLDELGDSDFIPRFDAIYPDLIVEVDRWNKSAWDQADNVKIIDIKIPAPQKIKDIISSTAGDPKKLAQKIREEKSKRESVENEENNDNLLGE
ncbi:MAG: YihY/virulence factor BrkB family protein [Muribaculaceae bacterium]|nr:YihY/virulence factor BrkB family protein [Muribaculaceae bacterium]